MNETDYHRLADITLDRLADSLEAADQSGELDVEYGDGALTIKMPSGRQLLLTKHTPTRQLWLASPALGGLHFVWEQMATQWKLPDGRDLNAVLMQELHDAGVAVEL